MKAVVAVVGAYLVLLAAAGPPSAAGSAPALPTGCTGSAFSFANNTALPITGGGPSAPPVTSTIQVSGAQPYLRDLDLVTDISHTFSADLDVTLTSPDNTVVTITTDNGGSNDNAFGSGVVETRWDDDANQPVTDATFVGVPVTQLVPEEAMGAFIGEDPNGTWTLSVTDDSGPDNGTLNNWALDLSTIEGTPTVATANYSGSPAPVIPNPGSASGSATVTLAGTYISRVFVSLDLTHAASGDLNISLRSPGATISTLSSNNGASFDDVFGDGLGSVGTSMWSDDAGITTIDPGGGPVTDAEFQDNVMETLLVPEEAMGAFIGENPNGTWSLDMTDLFFIPPPQDGAGTDSGGLNQWTLAVDTISGCTTGGGNTPPTADAGGPYTVAEGGMLNLDADASDPDPDTLTYSWDVNDDGTFGDATGESPTLSWDQLKALGIDDGPASFEVRVLVFDGEASTTSAPATLTVTNAPPSLAIGGPTGTTAGQSGTWTFTSADPSPDDQASSFQYAIDWDGDGTTDQTVPGAGMAQVAHTYAASGDFTIRATSTDQNGGQSAQATRAVTVTVASVVAPPGVTDACANRIRGTRGADVLTGTPESDRIIGRGGPDRIRGRGGDDCLKGGPGADRIRGGAGNDAIRVRSGGVDTVRCGGGTDTVLADIGDRLRGCEQITRS